MADASAKAVRREQGEPWTPAKITTIYSGPPRAMWIASQLLSGTSCAIIILLRPLLRRRQSLQANLSTQRGDSNVKVGRQRRLPRIDQLVQSSIDWDIQSVQN